MVRHNIQTFLGEVYQRSTARLNACVLGFENTTAQEQLDEVALVLRDMDAQYRTVLLLLDDTGRVGFRDDIKHEMVWVGQVELYGDAVHEPLPKEE